MRHSTVPGLRFRAVIVLLVPLSACAVQPTLPDPAPGAVPAPDEGPREPAPLPHVSFDLPIERNLTVEDELSFLVGERPHVLRSWMARGLPYRPFIEGVLAEHGLPRDLYYLAMIESGFVPTARSHAGAVGMWQFMPRTGRSEGLRIDEWVDERRDPVRATRAAAQHLARLYSTFGDWPLALAAYNAGTGRITRGMERFGARDYWELSRRGDLARETRRYVPRIYAVAMVDRSPAGFGLEAPGEAGWTFAVDSLLLDDSTPLTRLAEMTGVRSDTLRALNPNLLRDLTPPGPYTVWVPAEMGAEIGRRYAAALRRGGDGIRSPASDALAGDATREGGTSPAAGGVEEPPVTAETGAVERTHTVAEGEHLWTIARAYGVSIAALERANALEERGLRAGERLVIPAPESPAVAPGPTSGGSGAARGQVHRVEAGETLWRIARTYGVDLDVLRVTNGLDEGDPIRIGQELRIPGD